MRKHSKVKKTVIGMAALVLCLAAGIFAWSDEPVLPTWPPKNPSPEFLHAAELLKPLPADRKHVIRSSDTAIWECFGTLTDQQVKDFMNIHEERERTAYLSPQIIAIKKKNFRASIIGGYLVYKVRSVDLPIKDMSKAQRDALNRLFKAIEEDQTERTFVAPDEDGIVRTQVLDKTKPQWKEINLLPILYKNGAEQDLSNVILTFRADGTHDVNLIFTIRMPKVVSGITVWNTASISYGTFAYIK